MKRVRRMRRAICEPYHLLMRLAGDDFGGSPCAPGDQASVHLRDYPDGDYYVASVSEDAGTLWLGYRDKYSTLLGRNEALKLARFIVWRWWIRGEWFGLRRRVYFWALRRNIAQWRARNRRADVAESVEAAEAIVRGAVQATVGVSAREWGDLPPAEEPCAGCGTKAEMVVTPEPDGGQSVTCAKCGLAR